MFMLMSSRVCLSVCLGVVLGSILYDQPNPSADWPNPAHKWKKLDPTQYNEQCSLQFSSDVFLYTELISYF